MSIANETLVHERECNFETIYVTTLEEINSFHTT